MEENVTNVAVFIPLTEGGLVEEYLLFGEKVDINVNDFHTL